VSSKLLKLEGVPRVADRRMRWKDFQLRAGHVFGIDDEGKMYVCTTASTRGGVLPIWRCHEDTPIWYENRTKETCGEYSRLIGRKPVIMEQGLYASEWAFRWYPSSIPANSLLAVKIANLKKTKGNLKTTA